jgi:transcriptional regulator with XRE-family HTH domain
MRAAWTPDEDTILKSFAGGGMFELRRQLPDRSRASIKGRASRLGIKIRWLPSGSNEAKRGKRPIPRNAHPLVRQLVREINRQGAFLYEVGDRAGVARQTIAKWCYIRNPEITGLIAVANVLDMDLRLVRRGEEAI